MNIESIVLWIGVSHLLQPPLAFVLTRRAQFTRSLEACSPLVGQIGRNMAIASVALPTALGVTLALHAHETASGAGRSLAWIIATFWSWRLIQQWRGATAWRSGAGAGRLVHWGLSAIFLTQGPVLALLLLL